MTVISTHVLDAMLGKPAAGVAIQVARRNGDEWIAIGNAVTDADGRCRDLVHDAPEGVYRMTFFTGDYLAGQGRRSIYPEIAIIFACGGEPHLHLPILLSDNSYTTYRGS